jgi:hypothetical protein
MIIKRRAITIEYLTGFSLSFISVNGRGIEGAGRTSLVM